jgi:hypothetical protein
MRARPPVVYITALVSVFGVAAVGASAQAPVVPRSATPYEMARVVNESRRHGDESRVPVEVNLEPAWRRLGVAAGPMGSCSGGCEAETFRHELDGEPGKEVLLKLTRSFDSCRYLVFKRMNRARGKARWKLLGLVDHDFNRYRMSSHRVARAGGRDWLVVRGQEGSGTGFSLYAETWYEVGRRGLRPVLRYLSEGNVFPCLDNLGRSFKARVVPSRRARTVAVRYSVSYVISDCSGPEDIKLFTARHRVRYAWDGKARAFAFDPSRSDVPEGVIGLIADAEPEAEGAQTINNTLFFSGVKDFAASGDRLFLKYNLRGLLKVARGGDERRREWLRAFLERRRDTPEKDTLLKALRSGR